MDRFVRNCHTCQHSRTPRHAPCGVLRLLPIPDRPWQDITMDFVTGLPTSQGYDAIWVVVDRLTKARHFVPCRTSVDSVDHGSPAVRAAVRQDTPSKLPAQLSIWIFISHASDVYKKVLFRCGKSPPVLRFAMRSIPVASRAKTWVKGRFFARFRLRRNGY